MRTKTFDGMAGKNEKVDFLSEIGSMVQSQMEENQMLRRKKAENKLDEPVLNAEVEKEEEQPIVASDRVKESRGVKGRLKSTPKVERKKGMNVWFDVDTHKALGRIKLEHDIDMRDVAYIAIRKFLDEHMKDGELNEKGLSYLEKKLKELNG
jgi:hypothetical protein